ncbi:hypothetical protein F2P81_026057 [Scophthalmus maximus]|uniref:Uncharacterized protein n=1 Tax=Scophthalmus maximus TaxID=52904 RepID=A0A6A4RQM9_SCOMX|nr:hypothetical protein F2P81_026057 [Scophthalmus maximus]
MRRSGGVFGIECALQSEDDEEEEVFRRVAQTWSEFLAHLVAHLHGRDFELLMSHDIRVLEKKAHAERKMEKPD